MSMDLNTAAFYALAGLVIFSALAMLFSKDIVQAVFLLVLVFFGIAGIYLVSHAEFVGITQIMVYIGGVLVLMLFGVMLTNRIDGGKLRVENRRIIPSLLLGALLLTVFLFPLKEKFPLFQALESNNLAQFSTTEKIGINLMTNQLLVLELTGMLLLMALVGAAFLAGAKQKEESE